MSDCKDPNVVGLYCSIHGEVFVCPAPLKEKLQDANKNIEEWWKLGKSLENLIGMCPVCRETTHTADCQLAKLLKEKP